MRCHKQPQSIAKYLCHNLGVPAGTKPSRLPPPMVRRDVIAHLAKLELSRNQKGFGIALVELSSEHSRSVAA